MTAQTLLRTPGERLAKARHNAGMTQAAIADKLGISRRSVTRYEDDLSPLRPHTLMAWAHVTQVPLEWLERGAGPDSDIATVTDEYGWLPWIDDMHDPPCSN